MPFKKRFKPLHILFSTVLTLFILSQARAGIAQSPDGRWSDFVNISRTATASTYPAITSDKAGNVFAFWSEDEGGKTKNLLFEPDGSPAKDAWGKQVNRLADDGNTLYMARWNGRKWNKPVDVQTNPGGKIQYPSAVVDISGILHVVWAKSTGADASLVYSQAPAGQAEEVRAWSKPVDLESNILFAYYPVDIAADPNGGLHIFYSRLGIDPGAFVINSFDQGETWSDPIQLFSTVDGTGSQEGVSQVRLVSDQKGRLHATWSRYDATGNGRFIYYAQSRDQGKTWTQLFEVASWRPGWYEVDWLSVGVVGDEIHLIWEGSDTSALQVERVSYDGGLTWTGPGYILPKIVGENGFANLVTDSAGQLYLLIVKRGDSATLSHGVWFSSWDRDHWDEPILLGTIDRSLYATARQLRPEALQKMLRGTFTGGGLRYQMSTIVNGNELHVIVANEWDGEIWESHTTLPAPYIQPTPYPEPTIVPTLAPTPSFQSHGTPMGPETWKNDGLPPTEVPNPSYPVLIGVVPTLLFVACLALYIRFLKR